MIRDHKMQLLVEEIKNKTTAPRFMCNKLALVILIFFNLLVHSIGGTVKLTCHQCIGINCLRTNYESTQKCGNTLDICVNVFDGENLLAQGCWEQLPEELRYKCGSGSNEQTQNSKQLSECFKCNENLCNNLSPSSFECIQCDSDSDDNCRTNPLILMPSKCSISRTFNNYCFVKQESDRVIRGCSNTLEAQMSCLESDDCMICQPSELRGCNNIETTIDISDSGEEHTEDCGTESNSGNRNEIACHQCSGANCLRSSYEVTQKCVNDLDFCATVFEGETVLAQGCWEQLSEEDRNKCDGDTQCLKCNENLCNNLASSSFECIQCDSDSDDNCRTNPLSLSPSRCGISRTPNEYCFVKQDGNRVIRGCSYTLEDLMTCLSNDDCMICQPSELSGCNNMNEVADDSGSSSGADGDAGNDDSGGSDSGSGGSSTVNPEDGGSDNGESSENAEPEGGIDSGDGGSDSGDGGSDSGDGGSESGDGGSGDGSNGCSTSILNIFIVVNVIIVFFIKELVVH